jgi:hypothetical protein
MSDLSKVNDKNFESTNVDPKRNKHHGGTSTMRKQAIEAGLWAS